MSNILIIGDSNNFEIHMVHSECVKRLHNVIFIDYEGFNIFNLNISNNKISIYNNIEEIFVDIVWVRYKKKYPLSVETKEDVSDFISSSEWGYFSRGIMSIFGEISLNSYEKRFLAENKIWQQAVAIKSGFQLPESNFFIGKNSISAKIKDNSWIMKAIGFPKYPSLHKKGEILNIVTTVVNDEKFHNSPEDRFQSPIWFQKRIFSGIEIRVNVFGKRMFAYADTRPVESRRLVDGRIIPAKFKLYDLPIFIEENIKNYMSVSGLDYAAFDLIIDKDNCFFLECNPEGFWFAADDINEDDNISAFVDLMEGKIKKIAR